MPELTPLHISIFGLPAAMLVAQRRQLFAHHGLDVTFTRVASSAEQFSDFAAGRYQLVQTAFDNVASYHMNSRNSMGQRFDVRAVFALDAGMNLTVVSRPEIGQLEDLRGATVSVDAVTTGFAFVLFGMLERAGLARGDYTIVSHGGVASRLERLLVGEADATLLSNGLELVGMAGGLKKLAVSQELVDPYLGSVVAVSEGWYRDNQDVVRRFHDAYSKGLQATLDHGNREEVVSAIAEARSVPTVLAEAILDAELSPSGVARTTTIDTQAALNVLTLRGKFGGFESEQDLEALAASSSPLFV